MRLAELRRSRFVQLGLLIGAVATTLLCLALLFVYRVVDHAVLAQIDAEIDSEFSELARLINDDRTDEAISLISFRVGNFVGVDTFYLLIDARTGATLGNIGPIEPVAGWFTQPIGPAADELSIRAFGGTTGAGTYLAVGRATAALDSTRSQILGAFVLALAASTLASLGATAFLTVRLWRRVDDMRQDLTLVQSDIRMRLNLTGDGDEFDGIAGAVNHLLDRLEESNERLREVSVDIAHDLRTPLTRIRHRLETASEQSSAQQRHLFDEMAQETDRLIDTFNSILRIAQIEGSPITTERLDLSAITREIAEIYAPMAEEAGKPPRQPRRPRVHDPRRRQPHSPAARQPDRERDQPRYRRHPHRARHRAAAGHHRACSAGQWLRHPGGDAPKGSGAVRSAGPVARHAGQWPRTQPRSGSRRTPFRPPDVGRRRSRRTATRARGQRALRAPSASR